MIQNTKNLQCSSFFDGRNSPSTVNYNTNRGFSGNGPFFFSIQKVSGSEPPPQPAGQSASLACQLAMQSVIHHPSQSPSTASTISNSGKQQCKCKMSMNQCFLMYRKNHAPRPTAMIDIYIYIRHRAFRPQCVFDPMPNLQEDVEYSLVLREPFRHFHRIAFSDIRLCLFL